MKKLLITEIFSCRECAWISKDPIGYHHCRYNSDLLEFIPDKSSIPSFCPLPNIEGVNGKMLIKEISSCYDCSYCNLDTMGQHLCTHNPDNFLSLELWDVGHVRHNIHSLCPLPDIDFNPEK